jgi:hypothetical protein
MQVREDMRTDNQKVFGLGLSKTGTSSLTEALNLLGVKSVHYPFDQATVHELKTGKYDLMLLREFQSITDLPAVAFYKEFDAAYPGSKFVLTIRETDSWLRSCEMHWKLLEDWVESFPEFKQAQEFFGKRVYGRLDFNRDHFAAVYEQHVKDVTAHFQDRPNDLLSLNICAGEGWDKLCPFLNVDQPDAPFPHANEWMHLLLEAAGDVSRTIPEGETFVLVDEQGFGRDFAPRRRALPFLEREGVYGGAPSDGAVAVGELERMRREHGAKYIAFGWPAFWWLDHYGELRDHLRSQYDCILENKRLVIFDLSN